MVVPRGAIARQLVTLVALVTFAGEGAASASPSSAELVRQAQAHESRQEDDLAARRYTEAIVLDATDRAAYLGLGALRLRDGDAREAERVYDLALARLPDFAEALLGRAEARWMAGEHRAAETDLEAYAGASGDARVYGQLASWYAADGLYPAELALYRRLLADDVTDARTAAMVRALAILVGPADPATHPSSRDATRRGLANMARRR
jgi:tetratricopeptide (TPR) repeat protein